MSGKLVLLEEASVALLSRFISFVSLLMVYVVLIMTQNWVRTTPSVPSFVSNVVTLSGWLLFVFVLFLIRSKSGKVQLNMIYIHSLIFAVICLLFLHDTYGASLYIPMYNSFPAISTRLHMDVGHFIPFWAFLDFISMLFLCIMQKFHK